MSRQNKALPEEQQAKLIELLNRRLADAIDLQLQSRQANWNVKGPHFMALRELFDKVAQGVEEYANLIADRGLLANRRAGRLHAPLPCGQPASRAVGKVEWAQEDRAGHGARLHRGVPVDEPFSTTPGFPLPPAPAQRRAAAHTAQESVGGVRL